MNLDHVAALRRLGYDARFLVVRPADERPTATPAFPAGFDVPWQRTTDDLTPSDIVVVGEMFGDGLLEVAQTPARKIIHNQGPFYTFMAFIDLHAMRRWGCEAMVLPSHFAAGMARRAGWDGPAHVVRPALDPAFGPRPDLPRRLQVACMTHKRPQESRLIRGIVRSLRPDLNEVPWLEIGGVDRPEVARMMAGSDIFLALGSLEGLGLPPLEALACECVVAGFHAGGGQEYATPENGDWFDDGRHFEVAEALIALMDRARAGDRLEARRAAGRATAAGFSREAFEAQLAGAWASIAGPP